MLARYYRVQRGALVRGGSALAVKDGGCAMDTEPERLRTHELAIEARLAVLEQHGDHLRKILLQFIQAFALTVCARKSRDVPNV